MGMLRTLSLVGATAVALALGACSDQNAPVDAAHGNGWIQAHGAEAQADLGGCATCHGPDFTGSGGAVSCYGCHIGGPPFSVHPAAWTNVVVDHQGFADDYSWTQCSNAACHGVDLMGGHGSGETGPSCFTDTQLGCHADGPPPPHAMPYIDPTEHGAAALDQQAYCLACHGQPPNIFDGGFISDPDILANNFGDCSNAVCHPDAEAHPTSWTRQSSAFSHARVSDEAQQTGCALCHDIGEDAPGPNPQAPSCFVAGFTNSDGFTTQCHGPQGPGIAPHSVDPTWLLSSGTVEQSHVRAYESGDPTCLECHDEAFVPPLCIDCHNEVADPTTIVEGTCVSCHGPPPDGTSRANREGAHSEHGVLTPSTEDCSACHTDAGYDTLAHWDETEPADVNFDPVFDGNRGSAARNIDGTCSNVSCHGGQNTPVWSTGELVVAQDCDACHEEGPAEGIPEANSYYSGRHGLHIVAAELFGFEPTCAACHDYDRLQAGGHFENLETPEFEGDPAATMREELNYVAPTCTVSSPDPMFANCHPGATRTW